MPIINDNNTSNIKTQFLIATYYLSPIKSANLYLSLLKIPF